MITLDRPFIIRKVVKLAQEKGKEVDLKSLRRKPKKMPHQCFHCGQILEFPPVGFGEAEQPCLTHCPQCERSFISE
jgi:hypothetical protein